MKERGILFSAPMVRANRAGIKTQTRRTRGLGKINEAPGEWTLLRDPGKKRGAPSPDGIWMFSRRSDSEGGPLDLDIRCPYGVPGDRLWVRETWTGSWAYETMHLVYAADGAERNLEIPDVPADYQLPKAAIKPLNWVSPLFLPRWASRDTLEVVSVRPERLQDINETDCVAEGVTSRPCEPHAFDDEDDSYEARLARALGRGEFTAKFEYMRLWHEINGSSDWSKNKWVWRVEYRRL